MLDIRLLGQYMVTRDGRPATPATRPAALLLAWLVLNAGRPQPRESLADKFWPESSAANGRANLRHALWQLRAVLGQDYLLADTHKITFNRASYYALDVDCLTRLGPDSSLTNLLDAAAAYCGELLPGFYEPWIVLERERLAALYEQRMADLLERLVGERRWEEVVNWAERWLALGEGSELAYRALMQAHAARGDAGLVMTTYQRCKMALRDQLGVEPSTETRLLIAQLNSRQVEPPATNRHSTAGEDLAAMVDFERQRADFYLRFARRSNRLALGALLALAAAVGGLVASRRRE